MGEIKTKAAFVAVIGRPSAGKSTLVNQLCGEKVAIVSPVPQTTRNAIRGIVNREQGQLVFIDTPGRHKSEKKFNKKLSGISKSAINDSDIVLYMLDASRPPGPEEAEIAALLAPHTERIVAAINKIDDSGASCGADCERAKEFLKQNLPALPEGRCYAISAKNNEGLEVLLEALYAMAPEGEPFYGEEIYTDQEVDFRIAEIIREQAINRLRQELPHALYVEVAEAGLSENAAGRQKLRVKAFIVVEQESQKGIVIGKGGAVIKAIRLGALAELDKIFDWEITLELQVKTKKRWKRDAGILRRITER